MKKNKNAMQQAIEYARERLGLKGKKPSYRQAMELTNVTEDWMAGYDARNAELTQKITENRIDAAEAGNNFNKVVREVLGR